MSFDQSYLNVPVRVRTRPDHPLVHVLPTPAGEGVVLGEDVGGARGVEAGDQTTPHGQRVLAVMG